MKPIVIERRTHAIPRRKRQGFPWYQRDGVWIIAKYAALTLAGILLFRAGQARALIDRGYEALGGEVFALFLPAFYYLISRTVRDTIKDTKNEK